MEQYADRVVAEVSLNPEEVAGWGVHKAHIHSQRAALQMCSHQSVTCKQESDLLILPCLYAVSPAVSKGPCARKREATKIERGPIKLLTSRDQPTSRVKAAGQDKQFEPLRHI